MPGKRPPLTYGNGAGALAYLPNGSLNPLASETWSSSQTRRRRSDFVCCWSSAGNVQRVVNQLFANASVVK